MKTSLDYTNKTESLHLWRNQLVIAALPQEESMKKFMTLWNNFIISKKERRVKAFVEAGGNDASILILAFLKESLSSILEDYELVLNYQLHCLTLHDYGVLDLEGLTQCLTALKVESEKEIQNKEKK